MKIGALLLRLVVGGLFVGHGTQKLFGWFGGHGLDATAQGFEHLGMRPGRPNAIAAGGAEAGGGALLALGLETPFAASVLVATMLTAIQKVHGKNGPWLSNGGYEYNVVLIAAALALVEVGPGPLSLDARLGRERAAVARGHRVDVPDRGDHLVGGREQRAWRFRLEVEVEPAQVVPVLIKVVGEEHHGPPGRREIEHHR